LALARIELTQRARQVVAQREALLDVVRRVVQRTLGRPERLAFAPPALTAAQLPDDVAGHRREPPAPVGGLRVPQCARRALQRGEVGLLRDVVGVRASDQGARESVEPALL